MAVPVTPVTQGGIPVQLVDQTGTTFPTTGTGSLVFNTGPTLVNPIVGTQAPGNNTTLAASTAFVQAAIGGISAGLTVNTTTIAGGTTTRILYDNAGVLGEYTLTGTGTIVAMSIAPTFTGAPVINLNAAAAPTPVVGAILQATQADGVNTVFEQNSYGGFSSSILRRAQGTLASPTKVTSGLALGLWGTRGFATTAGFGSTNDASIAVLATEDFNDGTHRGTKFRFSTTPTASGTLAAVVDLDTTGLTVTSAGTQALAVGLTGATNPAFSVDASTGSQAAGLNVLGGTTSGAVALRILSSGINNNLTIDAKGSGTVVIAGTSTGNITLSRATTISTGNLTLTSGNVNTGSGGQFVFGSRAVTSSSADGVLVVSNNGSSAGVSLDVATNGIAKVRNLANNADAAITASSGTFSTTLATAAPAGSSAGLWKLGALQAGVVAVDTTRSIYVDIGGTVYHLMVST